MARIRTIKPDFFTSEDIMALSPLARLLYIGTWLDADRLGRLTWRPNTLKVRYLPGDDCDIKSLVAELIDRGLIVLYGDGLAYIPTFLEHQVINPREARSNIPDPDTGAIDPESTSWSRRRQLVLERDKACLRCGSTQNLDVDHILPQSAGGHDELSNLRAMCRSCNRKRPVAGEALRADLLLDGLDLDLIEKDDRHACKHASLRVLHPPSFHSLPLPSPSLPSGERIRVQGQGAFTPGSLPRDHMFHAICGPRGRLCLSQAVYGGLARRYGGDEVATKVAITSWVEALEREVGDGAIGDHLWLTRHFDVFLESVGRAPKAPAKVGGKPVAQTADQIKAELAARAKAREARA